MYCNKCGALIENSGHICRNPNENTSAAIKEARDILNLELKMIDKHYETRQRMLAEYYDSNDPLNISESFEFFLLDRIAELIEANERFDDIEFMKNRIKMIEIFNGGEIITE